MVESIAPVIDLDAPDATEQLDRACTRVGFFQCVGHGIPSVVLDELIESASEFFRLPVEEKRRTSPEDPAVERGYSASESEAFSYSMGLETPPDLCEGFSMGRPSYPDHPAFNTADHNFFAANVWPARPASLRSALETYYGEVQRVSDHVLSRLACALDLTPDFFVDKTDHSVDTLRINYFSATANSRPPLAGQFGIGPHTDYGIMTTMYATRGRGLQIVGPDGQWSDVVPADGALLFNLGDLLAQWTNDRYRSTLHRAVPLDPTSGGRVERISVPFFREGNFDNVVECLPSCCSADNPPKYQPVNAGEHLLAKFLGARTMEPATDGVSTLGERASAVQASL